MSGERGRLAIPGRSVAVGRRGMAATSHPLATVTALDVLRAGGTAADAGIAANAMLGVVEPMNCGLGGDLFAIYWDAKSRELHGLNASGRSPLALHRGVFEERGLAEIPLKGILSWSTPGCVEGWERLRQRFGSMPLAELLAGAIDAASSGVAVAPVVASQWAGGQEGLRAWADSASTLLIDGRSPRPGEAFRNPRLARSLSAVAQGGPEAFYQGEIAERIVAFSRAHGGVMSLEDFERHTSEWVQPVSTTYRGTEVFELPPNGQGIAVLQMLNLLEGFDLASLGYGHPDVTHLFIEAKKLAFADRARFYSDPAFGEQPVAELISKPYAAARRERIDLQRAATDIPHGDPRGRPGETVYLSVVDQAGNCCSLIQSNFYGFGSDIVPGDVGFAMQNRGGQFALDPSHPNAVAPHKRPFHTIIPAMAMRDGEPWLCFGVVGGDLQAQVQTQILMNMIDFGMNVQEAGDAPRASHAGSATPTGQPGAPDGGDVTLELGLDDLVGHELASRGHRVQGGAWGLGGYQAIMIDREHGALHGGSEPRKDGCALGW